MKWFEQTCDTPEENLALDEALLDEAESAGEPREVLRFWEAQKPFAVLGRSSRIADEVFEATCRREGIPVLRRCSGGATVLAGPGCLMYAVVLNYDRRPELRPIDRAHRFVLQTIAAALRLRLPGVIHAGTSDLAIAGRKISGNSLRCKRSNFLYHGTLLYDFPLELIARCLRLPARQPDYRDGRDHERFLTNLPLARHELRTALIEAWQAEASTEPVPQHRVEQLVCETYSRVEWTRQF